MSFVGIIGRSLALQVYGRVRAREWVAPVRSYLRAAPHYTCDGDGDDDDAD